MLTEQEKKWLTVRKKACARCSALGKCSQDQRNHCYAVGYPLRGSTVATFEYFRHAAEFEARVARCIAGNASELDMISNNVQFLDGFKAKSLAWYILREARIAVDEAMANGRNHA